MGGGGGGRKEGLREAGGREGGVLSKHVFDRIVKGAICYRACVWLTATLFRVTKQLADHKGVSRRSRQIEDALC